MIGDDSAQGWVETAVAEEFPELRLWYATVETPGPDSPAEVRERLRDLSNRFRGGQALALRTRPVPHAYRVFFRHIGLDPDVDRIPVEALAVERLRAGGFRSRTLIEDAVTIAVMETSVPVWALDAATVAPPLGIRGAARREPLGRGDAGPWLPEGRLCVADADGAVAVLFGDLGRAHAVGRRTRQAVVFSVQVAGARPIPRVGGVCGPSPTRRGRETMSNSDGCASS